MVQRNIEKTADHVAFYTLCDLGEKLRKASFNISRVLKESFFTPHSLLNAYLAKSKYGFRLLNFWGTRLLTSQCAELHVIARKGK